MKKILRLTTDVFSPRHSESKFSLCSRLIENVLLFSALLLLSCSLSSCRKNCFCYVKGDYMGANYNYKAFNGYVSSKRCQQIQDEIKVDSNFVFAPDKITVLCQSE